MKRYINLFLYMLFQLYLLHFASYFVTGGYLYTRYNKAKIQPASLTVREMKWILLVNFGVITPFCGYIISPYLDLSQPEISLSLLVTLFVELVLTTQFTNLLFTLIHLALHTSWGMKNIHYLHHRLRITHGLGAFYAHPIEHAVGNILPALLSLVLLASNIYSIALFILITTSNTVLAHTVFRDNSSFHHNYHHKYSVKNFGFFPYSLDKLLSTYHSSK